MDDYAYFNARLRAMQSRLLNRERYDDLLAQDTTAGIVENLKDSPYADALERVAAAPHTGVRLAPTSRLDEALRWDLTGTLSKLRRLVSDRIRELLEALLFRWDAYNVKTVVRGKRAAAPIEDVLAATFPVGILDEIALAELSRAPTLEAVADTLATWRIPLARPLREGLKRLGEPESLQAAEFELDRFVFAHAFEVATDGDDNDAVVRRYVRLIADRTNLSTALRFLAERSPLSPLEAVHHFIDAGGRLTRSHYEALVGARDLQQGLSLLTDGPFAWLPGDVGVAERLSLPFIERRLDRWMIRQAYGLARPEPLGIGLAIVYVERKINEVRNLRMIMRGKALGMGRETIEEWLII
ncbi:MAG: V-type ATP synthase subunit C [Nitrospiraceae bacterium]|nr:MAG: V-type ATP synthase subunit C [Nitrospiraceae bacterium]